MTLYKNGNMTIAGSLTQNSDGRLKDHVIDFTDASSLILKLRPVYYKFKNGDTHPAGRQIGFIAQEVREILPEIVTEDAAGYLSLDYGKMSVVIVQALKEQEMRIEKISEENLSLRNEIAGLKELQKKVDELSELVMKKENGNK